MVAKTHPPMYLMHKYWARKPHNVVAEYIKHYSKEGDIVLDPFAGSGVTAIEAIKLGRKAIAIDLDPMASFITRMTAIPIDFKKVEIAFQEIKSKLQTKINDLYKTTCIKCKKDVISYAIVWEKDKPKEILYNCNCSKKLLRKFFSDSDLKKLKEIENKPISFWYPKNDLVWNSRINVHKDEKVYELFTKRNLLALSVLLHEIENIQDNKIQEFLKFIFTSSLAQTSQIIPYMGGFKSGGASWKVRGFWVAEKRFELNVWNCFENRYKKALRGKQESNEEIKKFEGAKIFDELNKSANILIKTFNTLELEKILPPNSIDYVFTDPPYGDAIPYLELDYMWSSWLRFSPNFEDEIIISDSPVRDKKPEIYDRMLKAAFNQVFRVLKNGKYMTVTFHNTDIGVWNSIINACVYAGFDMEKIVYQPPAHTSSKAGLAPYGSAVGDYYIRFKKPEFGKLKTEEKVDEERYKRIVLESAKRIIAERGEPTPYTFILNGIIVELKKEGALLTGKSNPDDVMKEFLNKEFVLIDIKDIKGKVIGKKWWFKDPARIPYLEAIPLSDRVETAIVDVLRRKVKVLFDDILQEIFIKFPNALTPEAQDIKSLLEEYAKPTKDGNWQLKDIVRSRESDHSKLIFYLAILGQKAGYDVWIGSKEQGDTFNNDKLSKYVTNSNPIFRFIPSTNLDRVKQIDVIWHDDGRVKFEFEVENTTAITEAIVRGSNIPHDNVRRIIVIPEERERLLHRKLEEPMVKEVVEKDNWKFVFYKDVEDYYKYCKAKKKVEMDYLEKKFRTPKPVRDRQNSVSDFAK